MIVKSFVELRPNKLLLDPSFGGYKLSLDSIPIYKTALESGVKVVQPNDDQFSFYHVKLFSLHNHLYVNNYQNTVYFINTELKIFKVVLTTTSQTINLEEVYQIPGTSQLTTGQYNPSIVFPSAELALISNGSGLVLLAKIVESDDAEKWEGSILYNEEISCVLSDARVVMTDNKKILHVLLSYVEERAGDEEENLQSGLFHMKLRWRTFIEEGNTWKEKSQRELSVDGSVDYVALEPSCRCIYMVTDKSPKWVNDSENPIHMMEIDPPPPEKLYFWTQSGEEITVCLPVLESEKEDIKVSVDDLEIEIEIKGVPIISGQLFHRVSKELTTWSLQRNVLEIQLAKHATGLMWMNLVPGDDRGKEVLDEDVVQNVHAQLYHLCGSNEETVTVPPFNNQQLEDCDAITYDTKLVRIIGQTHEITHEVSLSSSPWLFKIACDPQQAPAVCMRNDVDACVWQFSEAKEDDKTWPHEHIGTFFAFGYVQASKTQKKFVVSPPNLSYVAICEASHHIYIYRQPAPLTTELKNRLTGKKVETISKQQLVNLEAREQILGVHATNNVLFVLLENSICVLVINV